MSEPTIRVAVPGNEKAIHEAHMRSINEICVKDHGLDEIRGWGNRPLGNRWIDTIKAGYIWVVEYNGQIYGHGYIRIFEENGSVKAHIHGLYLTLEVLNKGIGHKLATLMLEKAKSSKAERVTLESTISAHEFYKRLGFIDTGTIQQADIGGYPVRYFPMALNLTA